MPQIFPDDPKVVDGTNVQKGDYIDRTWQYDYSLNRWELVDFDRLSFKGENPIKTYARDGDIVTDFDIQDLQNTTL